MEADEVVARIVAGEYDEDLDRIWETIRFREKEVRKARTAKLTAGLKKGDKVRMSDTIRPQYLRGLEAEVVGDVKLGKKLKIRFVRPELAQRYGNGDVSVPADLVEKVDA